MPKHQSKVFCQKKDSFEVIFESTIYIQFSIKEQVVDQY